MYRSQLLLQQLGISQWIVRSEATVLQPQNLLWRDQEDVAGVPHDQNLASVVVKVADQSNPAQALVQKQPIQQVKSFVKDDVTVTATTQQAIILPSEVVDAPQTIHFDCHLLLHERFVVITQIDTTQEQRLFNQIVKACHASSGFIQWPLAIEMWSVNDDVLPSYLQGVFANYQDKVCVILGEAPFPLMGNVFSAQKKCASLQQLLESPQQKQALWQELYPLVYDIEPNNA